jgi:hypothetical protein
MDSMNHLNSSLDSLVEILNKSNHDFEIFNRLSLHQILRSKGIYPYRWVDSVEKFKETSLPSIEYFDNDLTGEKCTEERYKKAQEVWNTLNCKSFYDYHQRKVLDKGFFQKFKDPLYYGHDIRENQKLNSSQNYYICLFQQ